MVDDQLLSMMGQLKSYRIYAPLKISVCILITELYFPLMKYVYMEVALLRQCYSKRRIILISSLKFSKYVCARVHASHFSWSLTLSDFMMKPLVAPSVHGALVLEYWRVVIRSRGSFHHPGSSQLMSPALADRAPTI